MTLQNLWCSVGADGPVAVPDSVCVSCCRLPIVDRCHSLKSLLPLCGAPIAPLDDPHPPHKPAESRLVPTKSPAFCFVIFFAKQRVIFPCREVILKPCGFSDILFAFKLPQAISLELSFKYHCFSNITRLWRIKLPKCPYEHLGIGRAFLI